MMESEVSVYVDLRGSPILVGQIFTGPFLPALAPASAPASAPAPALQPCVICDRASGEVCKQTKTKGQVG
jgi:hypothetical protein